MPPDKNPKRENCEENIQNKRYLLQKGKEGKKQFKRGKRVENMLKKLCYKWNRLCQIASDKKQLKNVTRRK